MADTLPRNATARASLRRDYERRELQRARALAASRERSLKCGPSAGIEGWPRHADQPGGCRNTGETCLCECHDQPDQEADR